MAILAAQEGNLERLMEEVSEGTDVHSVNRKDEDGRTALHWAAANKPRPGKKHAECVEFLLQRGAKVCTHDDGGWTPFMSACAAGNAQTVRLLVQAKAEVDEEEENSQCTPLHMAASKAHLDVVKELLQAGASVQSIDGNGQQALHRAASSGNASIVRLLLADGAKVNAADKEGMTPLHLSMYERHEAATLALLEAGASTSAQNKEGNSALALAPDSFCAQVMERES